jgi:hypothetical protein
MLQDPKRYRDFFESLSTKEIEENNRNDHEEHKRQVMAFKAAYAKGRCYLCGEPFDQMRGSQPCTHWLLRRCKFKKNDFEKVWKHFDYHNVASFLRWCANEEAFLKNINNLDSERSERKILSCTIKWKNVEWTFDCTASDLAGHGRTHSAFPHYHFQMRLDGRPFIKFNDFHVPFSDRDLFNLSLREEPWFHQSFGTAGDGMQEAVSVPAERILELTIPTTDEEQAPYHLSTIIYARDRPISGKEIWEIREEAKRTNKSLAYVTQQRLADSAIVQTTISPGDTVPDIANRTERKPR